MLNIFVSPPVPGAIENIEHSQSLTAGEQALLDHVREHEGDAEVICIVRPRGASQADSEVFMLQNASSNFMKRLSDVHNSQVISLGETKELCSRF